MLASSRLLNLLRMPHFGNYRVTDRLVHQLLALVHDGSLWIQDRIPIDAMLIHQITGLPMEGPDPMLRLGKKYEQKIANSVHDTYHVLQNTLGFMISTNSDPRMQMGTLLLACKLMRKC